MADNKLSYSLSLSQEQWKHFVVSVDAIKKIFDQFLKFNHRAYCTKDIDLEVNRKIWEWAYLDKGLFAMRQVPDVINVGEETSFTVDKESMFGLQYYVQMALHVLPALYEKCKFQDKGPLNEMLQSIQEIKVPIYELLIKK